jgi:TIR domain
MARIFISYAQQDGDYVKAMANALRELGQDAFYSEDSLILGQRFQAALSKNLREADGIIFVLSKKSLESRYVLTEMGAALGYFGLSTNTASVLLTRPCTRLLDRN